MKQQPINKRYKTSTKYPGIRKDLIKERYLVELSLDGRRLSKTFLSFQEAINWRAEIVSKRINRETTRSSFSMRFGELWNRYKRDYLPTLEISSQQTRLALGAFFDGLLDLEVESITPNTISTHLFKMKQRAQVIGSSRRQNFHNEIKLLRAIFNWYTQEINHLFTCPVLKKHKKEGILRVIPAKSKKLSLVELKAFFSQLQQEDFWYRFALLQFLTACRVSEIAGLQWKSVCFKTHRIFIRDVAVWSRTNKKFLCLKAYTKNTDTKIVHMTPELEKVLHTQLLNKDDSDFVFSLKGAPLDYREIQYHYDRALKRAGLSEKFSGTHLLRHSMATLTRSIAGSIDAVQAVTGHKDWKLAQHYGVIGEDQNKKALNAVEQELNRVGFFLNAYEQAPSSYEQHAKEVNSFKSLDSSGTP